MKEQEFIERRNNLNNNWFYSICQKTVINIFIYSCVYVCYYMYSHLNSILDIRVIRYIDLLYSAIKHVITVDLRNIKTNNKGKELNSLIIHDKTYI